MQRKYFYIVRHGESLGNIGLAADPDAPLSPNGRAQAAFCAEFLHKECYGSALIMSSPFMRCIQTAQSIADKMPGGIVLEPLLHELYSDKLFPDKTKFKSLKEIASSIPGIVGRYHDGAWMPEKHETHEEMRVRLAILRNTLVSEDPRMGGRFPKAILVAHWASIVALVEVVCGVTMPVVDNCSVTKILFTEGKFHIEYMNRTDFIPKTQG